MQRNTLQYADLTEPACTTTTRMGNTHARSYQHLQNGFATTDEKREAGPPEFDHESIAALIRNRFTHGILIAP